MMRAEREMLDLRASGQPGELGMSQHTEQCPFQARNPWSSQSRRFCTIWPDIWICLSSDFIFMGTGLGLTIFFCFFFFLI